MSRTLRFCNKSYSPLFEHSFKFMRRHCKCSYCIDPESSKHRRERGKIDIRRELENLSDPASIRFPHFPCINWKEGIFRDSTEDCQMEVKLISMRRPFEIK